MKEYIITKKDQGKKLFRFVKSILPGLKNNDVFKIIRKKTITINNKKAEPDYIINDKDSIKIYLSEKHFENKSKKNKFISIKKDLDIIYEDNDILVINKPLGILVHPDSEEYKNNLYEIVRSYLFAKNEYDPADTFTPTPCHRLDRNTTGIIIFAKNHYSLKNITSQFKERTVKKTYITITYGSISKEILITSILENLEDKVKVSNIKVLSGISDKETFLKNNPKISAMKVLPLKKSNNLSLVEIDLWTGRKHQIRAQLAAYGTPLLGDIKYYTKNSYTFSKKINLKNYYLHSIKLKINGYDEWKTQIPKDFKNMINKLF